MYVIYLVIPGGIRTYIRHVRPWAGNSSLGRIAEQTVKELVVSVVHVVIQTSVALESVVNRRLLMDTLPNAIRSVGMSGTGYGLTSACSIWPTVWKPLVGIPPDGAALKNCVAMEFG